jgi:pyridoxal phosphate enzyme (YggS family)
MRDVAQNYRSVRSEIDACAASCGRDASEILLLAVSKTMPSEDIAALYDIGVRDFGENRIQELERKVAGLPEDIVWHFIGPLQSNKIRKAVKLASVIHSVEDISAVERLDRIAGEEQKKVKFLIEVNVSGELSKGGVTPADFMEIARAAAKCRTAVFSGLMTMAPFDAPQEVLDSVFTGLAALKKQAEQELKITLPILSMGMSGDYPNAIAAGSTIVRVGTAIFGKSSYAL